MTAEDLTAEDLACLGLHRTVEGFEDWDWTCWPEAVAQQREADAKYARAMAAISRRERKEQLAREIAVIKAMQKAGLPVRRATIEGVDLEFGQPEPARAAPVNGTAGDLNEWDADLGIQTSPLRQ